MNIRFYDNSFDVVVSAPDGGVNLRSGPGTKYDVLYSMILNGTHLTGFGCFYQNMIWKVFSNCAYYYIMFYYTN